MRVTLDQVCYRGSSNLAQKEVSSMEGPYPIYGASGQIATADFYHQSEPYVAVVKDGAGIGRTMLLPAYSSVIGTLQYLLPKENILPDYLCYVVRHMKLAKYFSGATIPHIYFRDYKNEEFNLEPIERQKEIVSILNKLQQIIEHRRAQLAKLDELVKCRFVELFGDICNPCNRWSTSQIRELVTVEPQNGLYKAQSFYVKQGATPILRIDAFYNGKVTNFIHLKRLKCTPEEIKKYLLHENDIVINRVNSIEYLGKCALIQGLLEDTVFESNMMRFHLNENKIDPFYATFVLSSQYTYVQILSKAKKAVNQASINQKDVLSLNLPVPPLHIQQQFSSFVQHIDKLRVSIQASLDKTQQLFDSLMQEYFD